MLDDPSHISQGSRWQTVGENNGRLVWIKYIDKALERLNVSREKQKIILKREQETAVKELLAGRDIMAILPKGFGNNKQTINDYSWSLNSCDYW